MINWTISEIKQRGMATFKGAYWRCVLVAFVMSLVSGGLSVPNFSSFNYKFDSSGSENSGFNIEGSAEYSDLSEVEALVEEIMNSPQFSLIVGAIIVGILIAMIISIALSVFLLTPLIIGCQKFFKEAGEKRSYELGSIVFAFKGHYMNVVKISFLMGLKVFLWSLLFIIPGIIKTYEYRMIPYILGDDPSISSADAFRRSRELMTGHKWHSFLLDLSFIGWILLGVLTCGLLILFYVNPYIAATDAELYLTLKGAARDFNTNNGPYNGQPYYGQQYNAQPPYGQQPYSQQPPYGAPQQPYNNMQDPSSQQNYTDAEYREVNAGGTDEKNDTPAFGDERNRTSGNDKPFNTPY